MLASVIGAQLYTLRDYLKTPEDIAKSLKKVREIGYEVVQLSGLGPIDTKELKKILDGEGLTVCMNRVSFQRLQNELEQVIWENQYLRCKYVAVGSMPEEYRNQEGYAKFAKDATAAGEKLAEAGLVFGYHNHSFELEKYNGKTGLEIFYEASDPRFVVAELDTYWLAHGGSDPIVWIDKLADRIPVVHLKDMTIIDNQQVMAEVGEGNLNWPGILKACQKSRVQWYVVEQDICQRNPFESLAISFRNLKQMGLE
jgi:sugar phosphate isomerase/epimerase